jgi:RNA polymerase sigma-70 factor (ECF subfamily)
VETDEALYAAWADGDAAAGSRLVDRYLERIGRFFANKVLDGADTEDLVGETFELCARSLGRFRGDSSFRTYLFGIAKNVLRDYIKKRGRRPGDVDFRVTAIGDLGPSPSVIVGERREQGLLLEALRRIPLELQIVIELSFFEEMSQAEIAALLELPPGTVASRIRRGKEQLFARIEALADSPGLLESTLGGLRGWAAAIQAQLAAMGPEGAEDG